MPQGGASDVIAKAGDEDRHAFDTLLGPLIEPACRLAAGILLDRAAAEDAVQEASLRAWRKLGNLRQGSDPKPWFLAIVANQCRTAMRGSWWSVIKGAERLSTGAPAEDQLVEDIDLIRGIKRLRRLDRAILVLYYYCDLPLQQTAAILNISHPAAKSRLYRAIHQLRRYLKTVEVRI